MAEQTWLPLSPREAHDLMAGFPHRWWVAGGWAIDLFVARTTRPHADMDIAILRGAEPSLRSHFPSWDIQVAHDGAFEQWSGELLRPPCHQFFARRAADNPWALEVLLEDHADGVWRFRRDASVRMPIDALTSLTSDGIPYLRPEVVLLYKARTSGDDDTKERDFAAAAPQLDAPARRWLHDALVRAHPGHHWIGALE